LTIFSITYRNYLDIKKQILLSTRLVAQARSYLFWFVDKLSGASPSFIAPGGEMLIYPHTLLILLHLLAFAIGLGSALLADWVVLTKLTFMAITERAAQQLLDLSYAVAMGLVLLWTTGAILVGNNALADPSSLNNHKLWAKVVIVVILTVNALLLHSIVLPTVQSRIGRNLFDATFARLPLLCTFVGTVSATSWMFAAYLGCARELNGTASFVRILCYYGAALLFAWATSLALTYSARHRITRPVLAHLIQRSEVRFEI